MTWRKAWLTGWKDALWPLRLTVALLPSCALAALWKYPLSPVWQAAASALLVAWQVRNLLRFPWRELWAAMMRGW
jgi:hypothetical protein